MKTWALCTGCDLVYICFAFAECDVTSGAHQAQITILHVASWYSRVVFPFVFVHCFICFNSFVQSVSLFFTCI